MAENTLALLAEVAAICEQLVDDPDAAKIMLDSVLSGFAALDGHITNVGESARFLPACGGRADHGLAHGRGGAGGAARPRGTLPGSQGGRRCPHGAPQAAAPNRQAARLHPDLRHHQARLAALPPRRGPQVRGRSRRRGRVRRVEARHGAHVRDPRDDLHPVDVLLPLGLSGAPLIDRARHAIRVVC